MVHKRTKRTKRTKRPKRTKRRPNAKDGLRKDRRRSKSRRTRRRTRRRTYQEGGAVAGEAETLSEGLSEVGGRTLVKMSGIAGKKAQAAVRDKVRGKSKSYRLWYRNQLGESLTQFMKIASKLDIKVIREEDFGLKELKFQGNERQLFEVIRYIRELYEKYDPRYTSWFGEAGDALSKAATATNLQRKKVQAAMKKRSGDMLKALSDASLDSMLEHFHSDFEKAKAAEKNDIVLDAVTAGKIKELQGKHIHDPADKKARDAEIDDLTKAAISKGAGLVGNIYNPADPPGGRADAADTEHDTVVTDGVETL